MILDRKQLWILWIGLGLFISAFIWDAVFSGERNVYRYRYIIEKNLQEQERAVEDILNDKAFIERRLNVVMAGTAFKEDAIRVEELQQQPFNICIFKGDSAIFWTHNDVLPDVSHCVKVDSLVGRTQTKLDDIKQSQFELRYRFMRSSVSNGGNTEGGDIVVAALIPLKRVYGPFEGKYLESHYIASSFIPKSMELVENGKKQFDVHTIENKPLCSLALDFSNDADRMHDIGMIILLVVGFFMLGMFGDRMSKQMLAQNESPMMGITFFIGTLIALRGCIYFIEGSALLPTTDLQLTPYSDAVFMHSLSELIINTVFLFWFSIFFNKEFHLPNFKQQPLWVKWSLAVGCYTILISLNILSIGIFNDLVSHWKNIMSFENLTDFNEQTIVTILSMGLIQMSVFLISHRLIVSVKQLEMNKLQQFCAQGAAVFIGITLYQAYHFSASLPIGVYAVFLLVYISIFHLFVKTKESNISWLVLWIVIFAAIQAFFVSRLSTDKERTSLYSYAHVLANERDQVAEGHIKLLIDTIAHDPWIKTSTLLPFRIGIDPKHIEEQIKFFFETDDYLSDHYSLSFWGINKTGEAIINPDSIQLPQLQKRFSESILLKDYNCSFWSNKKGENAYLSHIELPLRKENPLSILLEFTRVDRISSRIFTEILAEKHYKRLAQLNEYSYVIYKNGISVEQNQHGPFERTINHSQIPPKGQFFHDIVDNQDQVTYQNSDGIVVRISKYIPLSSQGFTMFIYFILVLTLLLLLLIFINHLYPFLPDIVSMSFTNSANTSLRYRIMIPVILFILLSYAVVFAFTFGYYKKVGEKFYTSEFENKAKTIMKNLRKDFQDDIKGDKDLINACLSRHSDTYEMAMHFFNTEGVLEGTTESNIFDKGILAPRMNPTAYMKLRQGVENTYRADENIGDFHYKSSFYALRDSTEKKMLGFIELPFYSRDRNLRLSASDMWSYSAGFLTFLFILCISIISMQTARLIQPLQQVADTLRRLRVEKTVKNELIVWDKKDEIGALINAYNNKVTELEEAILQLAEAEREGAWRDMARQVAHEIRNPLTPMKLVVQHLEMMRLQGNENMVEYTSRSNRVLLEQIASLENIVNEFHSFARMPNKATNIEFPLNDLVQSVSDLFAQHNHEGKKLEVTLTMPNETFIVYADRALLTSAFNNLIKNAIQSIPPDRDGIISIKLYRENNTAVVKISDNGSGIPKDIQDKIFSPNFTTKAYGSGIGLLITKNIIQSVSGKISFETIENEGTDFFVQLEITESYKIEPQALVNSH